MVRIAENDREKVVEIMSDSARQSAQRFHFVGLERALVHRPRLNLFRSRLSGPQAGLFRDKAPPEQGDGRAYEQTNREARRGV
jgi:hypothetical protein